MPETIIRPYEEKMVSSALLEIPRNTYQRDLNPERVIQTTRRCIEAGKIMDIPCLDHVIVGGGNSDY